MLSEERNGPNEHKMSSERIVGGDSLPDSNGVTVSSRFGSSVTACRSAEAWQRVLALERGPDGASPRPFRPGSAARGATEFATRVSAGPSDPGLWHLTGRTSAQLRSRRPVTDLGREAVLVQQVQPAR